MNANRDRVDEPQPPDDRRLIEMGHLVLKSLAAEARAARAESQQAELEMAIAEASLGSPDLLRSWFAHYQSAGTSQSNSAHPTAPNLWERGADRVAITPVKEVRVGSSDLVLSPTDAREATPDEDRNVSIAEADPPNALPIDREGLAEFVASKPATEPVRETRSWDQLLPHARARLAALTISSDPPATSTSAANTQIENALLHAASEDLIALRESPETDLTPTDFTPTDAGQSAQDQQTGGLAMHRSNPNAELSEPDEQGDLYEPDEPGVKAEFNEGSNRQSELLEFELASHEPEELEYDELAELQGLETSKRADAQRFFRSDKRGLLVSVVVHTLMIGSLMAITMRVPNEVASLGFESQAVDGDFESIEISQPVEIATPEVTVESPSEPTTSSPSSLPSTTSVLSSSSGVNQATASSSMASSLAESAGKAVTGGGKPSLSKVNASFFGAAAGGNSFCYVIDGSESMRGGAWEAAKRELLRSLSTLKENQRFYIIFFNQELNAITQPGEREPSSTALYATPENVMHAQNWVESLRIARGAPPGDALEKAIELELDAIYFLADGATKVDVPSFLRTKNRTTDFISGEQIRVPIHAIAFYSPETGQRLMQKIASENKGQFIYVPDPRTK